MSQERYNQVKALFLRACDLEGAKLDEFLGAECGADRALRCEVEALLGADNIGVPILEVPVVPLPQATSLPMAEVEWLRLAEASAARRYRVEGEISRGGMGAILRVEDSDLGRDLAMKVALGSTDAERGSGETPDLGRFLEEAQITAQLEHPGIAPVHDLGVDSEGRLYFTMKLVHGRDLREVFRLAKEGDPEWTRTRLLGIMLKVCDAMAYAHDKGVVHRDLKPANVMVGAYGEVYTMDWGVAKVLGQTGQPRPLQPVQTQRHGQPSLDVESGSEWLTRAGSVVGTPYYMPPEQARGGDVGPEADVYALGAMLYQLLTGQRPYESDRSLTTAAMVLIRLTECPPDEIRTLVSDAPPELVAICERAMQSDPGNRYPNMSALGKDLRAYLEGRVVHAYENGSWAELRKWVGRNKLAASGIVLALTSLVGGLWWSARAEAASRHEIEISSDYYLAKVLLSSTDDLWPAAPEKVPALEDWKKRTQALLTRRPEQQARLNAMATDNPNQVLSKERQEDLLADLTRLEQGEDGEPSLVAQIDARLAFAQSIESLSVSGESAALLWKGAHATIEKSERYRGLKLDPQLGLLPLGPDPQSGLWEFVHLESGSVPVRDAEGMLVRSAETGLVFVLIPGGTFSMGASKEEGAFQFDDQAASWESPVLEVTLGPYFLSKFEMTQSQWHHCTRNNPSKWQPGEKPKLTWTNPVEQVSWGEADFLTRRMGLVLPTESQWEHACRAGTHTPLACDPSEYGKVANVADQSFVFMFGEGQASLESFDDGFALHAPVGSLLPNTFGLHDMHGNVFEWTQDVYGGYRHTRREGDGLLLQSEETGKGAFWSPDYRMVRGGNFEVPMKYARSANRVNLAPATLSHGLGLRPARAVSVPSSN